MMDVLETAQNWHDSGRRIAIATVIETWGSAPQPVGSQLVVDSDGNFEGAVSGGCVEGAVITEAQDMIATGGHKVLSFGIADETAWKVGLACGGKIRVLVEAVR
jgi:xanthine/CO dehydrogenase XdhC/CoxF family maturation factor